MPQQNISNPQNNANFNNPSMNSQQLQLQQQQQQNANSSSSQSTAVSYHFMKQYFNSDQREGLAVTHTSDFKKFRDNSIGRYVIQTNKLLITLDKLITFDVELFTDDYKRECILIVDIEAPLFWFWHRIGLFFDFFEKKAITNRLFLGYPTTKLNCVPIVPNRLAY